MGKLRLRGGAHRAREWQSETITEAQSSLHSRLLSYLLGRLTIDVTEFTSQSYHLTTPGMW